MTITWKQSDLEKNFPSIPWRVPLPVAWVGGGKTFTCRICVANLGLKKDSEHQWSNEDEALRHILKEHLLQ